MYGAGADCSHGAGFCWWVGLEQPIRVQVPPGSPLARCPLACAAPCPAMGWLEETRKIRAPGAELQTPGFHVSQTWILACQKPHKKNWPHLQVAAKKFLLTRNIMNTCSQKPSKMSQTRIRKIFFSLSFPLMLCWLTWDELGLRRVVWMEGERVAK